MKMYRWGILLIICAQVIAGCQPTYRKDDVENSIKRICHNEYGIDQVEVQIKGKTLGVYLPLQQLFSVDYEKFLSGGATGNLENLMQFHPEALNKVEDVLFTTSRVILSTNRPIDFYLLNATDTVVTGIQFVIIGYVEDMKRVRFWDISRSEYRKRLIHDLSINKSVIWKRTVVELFKELPELSLDRFQEEYLMTGVTLDSLSPYFVKQLTEDAQKENLSYAIQDIRAKPIDNKQVLVYAKVKESYTPPKDQSTKFIFPNGYVGEYLFVLKMQGLDFKIVQVVPFYVIGDDGTLSAVKFPDELKIYQNLDTWPKDFEFDEITLEDFMAEQITKRIEGLVSFDKRIKKNFVERRSDGKINCTYIPANDQPATDTSDQQNRFRIYISMRLRDKLFLTTQDLQGNSDVQYLLSLILFEVSSVLEAYHFENYANVEIRVPLMKQSMIVDRTALEDFGKKKLPIDQLLHHSYLEDIL